MLSMDKARMRANPLTGISVDPKQTYTDLSSCKVHPQDLLALLVYSDSGRKKADFLIVTILVINEKIGDKKAVMN